jgi:hypothetical protein
MSPTRIGFITVKNERSKINKLGTLMTTKSSCKCYNCRNYAIYEESFCSSDWRSVNWESARGRAALSTTWPSYPPSTPRPTPRSPSPAESGAGQVQHIPWTLVWGWSGTAHPQNTGLGLARYSTSPEHWSGAGQVQHIPWTLVWGWSGTAHPQNTGLGLARYSTSPEHWSRAGQVQHILRTLVWGWSGTAHPQNTGLGLARYSTFSEH